jgi:hypothetical protein
MGMTAASIREMATRQLIDEMLLAEEAQDLDVAEYIETELDARGVTVWSPRLAKEAQGPDYVHGYRAPRKRDAT